MFSMSSIYNEVVSYFLSFSRYVYIFIITQCFFLGAENYLICIRLLFVWLTNNLELEFLFSPIGFWRVKPRLWKNLSCVGFLSLLSCFYNYFVIHIWIHCITIPPLFWPSKQLGITAVIFIRNTGWKSTKSGTAGAETVPWKIICLAGNMWLTRRLYRVHSIHYREPRCECKTRRQFATTSISSTSSC